MSLHTSFLEAWRQSSKHFFSTDMSVLPQGGARNIKEQSSFTQHRFTERVIQLLLLFPKYIFDYLCESVQSDVEWAQRVKFRLNHLQDRCIAVWLAMQGNCFTLIGHNCSTIKNTWHFAWLSNHVNDSGPDASPQFGNRFDPPQWLDVGVIPGKTLLICKITHLSMIPHTGDELSSGTLNTLIIHPGKYLDSQTFHVELNFSHLIVRRTERLKHMERFFSLPLMVASI